MRIANAIFLLTILTACGDSDRVAADAERDSVFDPLSDSLQEAQDLEEVALKKKREMDEALKRMEGDAPPEAD